MSERKEKVGKCCKQFWRWTFLVLNLLILVSLTRVTALLYQVAFRLLVCWGTYMVADSLQMTVLISAVIDTLMLVLIHDLTGLEQLLYL